MRRPHDRAATTSRAPDIDGEPARSTPHVRGLLPLLVALPTNPFLQVASSKQLAGRQRFTVRRDESPFDRAHKPALARIGERSPLAADHCHVARALPLPPISFSPATNSWECLLPGSP